MIIRENIIEVDSVDRDFMLKTDDINRPPEELIFFDLEHYVYKKPKCIGVFGACIFEKNKLIVTQYMIESKYESIQILELARKYFFKMKNKGKKAIVTFSGNNDYTVINYLFKKYGIQFNFSKEFDDIDIQREYEKIMKHSIGLKNLEREFNLHREGEVISGSNLAKTFNRILKDKEYILRMPKEKIDTILLYNEQDVTNLYYIYMLWKSYIDNKNDKIDDDTEKENLQEEVSSSKDELVNLNQKNLDTEDDLLSEVE